LREWFIKLWNDIKGNVKYAALLFLAGAVLSGVGLLIRGLSWWQDAILFFFFGGLLAWSIAATVWALRAKPRGDSPSRPLPETSLRDRVFTLCNELSVYAGDRKVRPDEAALYAQFKGNGALYAEHYDAEIQSWDDKLNAGYWLRYRERAVNLRHELVLNDVRDNALDAALGALERAPDGDYLKHLQTVIEKFRYAASALP
jgi:hypothetical protein